MQAHDRGQVLTSDTILAMVPAVRERVGLVIPVQAEAPDPATTVMATAAAHLVLRTQGHQLCLELGEWHRINILRRAMEEALACLRNPASAEEALAEFDRTRAAARATSSTQLQGRLLSEIRPLAADNDNELLFYRFLCRGAASLLVGPTGIGKSSLLLQLLLHWALGLMCFGLAPRKALRCLLIQGENDDGDLARGAGWRHSGARMG